MTHPLAGLTVLDLSEGVAGPYCTMTLADLGASVIKIERPGGDPARGYPPFKDGRSAPFVALNRGKRAITLDLSTPEGCAVLDRLLLRADVLVDSHAPGALERLGYGWDALHGRYPHLIQASVTGYGQTGPEARHAAGDTVAQARAGLMALTGTDRPARAGSTESDLAAALFLAQGILAALVARAANGTGRRLDVALLDAQLAFLHHAVASTAVTGKAPPRTAARHPLIAPCEAVSASDGPFVLAAPDDASFDRLCLALALPVADDARFATNADRVRNARLLRRLIEAVTLEHPVAHWLARLSAAGVPAAPVQGIDQVMKDPQIAARNMLVDVLDRNGRAAFRAAGNPVKMTDAPDPTTRGPAPDPDGNRGEILRWLEQG